MSPSFTTTENLFLGFMFFFLIQKRKSPNIDLLDDLLYNILELEIPFNPLMPPWSCGYCSF